MQDLFEKGLSQRPRILELQRLIAGLKADASQTRAFLGSVPIAAIEFNARV
jgi:hypothetical protein